MGGVEGAAIYGQVPCLFNQTNVALRREMQRESGFGPLVVRLHSRFFGHCCGSIAGRRRN
jgi:hypothetical protein